MVQRNRGRMAIVATMMMVVSTLLVTLAVVVGVVSAATGAPESLGQGQRVISVFDFPDGRGFIADLEVIEQTELYGPDIGNLRMTVRYPPTTRMENFPSSY